MESVKNFLISKKDLGIRLLYTVFFLIILEILTMIIKIAVVCQYIFLLVTSNHNEPVRNLSNRVAAYAYKIIRFTTLNENEKPFPFADFPVEKDSPDMNVKL